jgi:nicotinamidase-related amidase
MINVDPSRTALLVMDLQKEVAAMFGEKTAPVLERTAAVLAAARKAKMHVLYIGVGFRPGLPEIKPGSPMYERISKMGGGFSQVPQIAEAVKPQDDEVVITKKRVSAFAGSDLEVILRAKGIDTLVLTGIATSGVVLSTVRQASDLDYKLFVIKDCCADRDDEVHRVLTEKVFVGPATVITAADFTAP